MPFLDDIPMRGCAVEEKDETMDYRECRKFVVDHMRTLIGFVQMCTLPQGVMNLVAHMMNAMNKVL